MYYQEIYFETRAGGRVKEFLGFITTKKKQNKKKRKVRTKLKLHEHVKSDIKK